MLRVTVGGSAEAAKRYFDSALSRGDYYAQGQEIVGLWGGRGAELLKLGGEVDRASFAALCDNRDPRTGERLTQRTKTNRRVGYDFTFSVPKSVSVVQALTGDGRMVEAFRSAVGETMQELERDMQTRVRKRGAFSDRHTGNMVWGEFVHFTSRPVDGVPDPHLHAHCFAFNCTYDEVERQWKAGEFSSIKRDAPYYEAAFENRLAMGLRKLGYQIERRGEAWELAGVPTSVVRRFSRRTAEIEAKATEKGITDPDAKGELGAKTRAGKAKELSTEALRATWEGWLAPRERSRVMEAAMGNTPSRAPGLTPESSLEQAVSHMFERRSVVDEKRLLAEALRRGVGTSDVASTWEARHSADLLSGAQGGRVLCTTREVLAEEREVLAFARDGRGRCKPLAPEQLGDENGLGPDQQRAVRHVLGSRDRVMAIRGGAGTGKTTLMQTAIRGVEAAGTEVHVFAPTADAARDVLRREGFSGAETVARLLNDRQAQERVQGGVIWVDEAGLLGVRTMHQLFQVAKEQKARVVLSGDERQHAPVDRGDGMRLLLTRGGVQASHVSRIYRQRGSYREAVQAISDGKVKEGFEQLESMGAVRELSGDDRHSQLAEDYLKATREGAEALVVSPTHAEGAQVTEKIRNALRSEGRLGLDQASLLQLRRVPLTEAQKADPAHYSPGQVVQFHQNVKGIRAGERLTISSVGEGGAVFAERAGGGEVALPLTLAKRFELFEERSIALAEGEKVRITRNGRSADRKHAVNNGALYRFEGVTEQGKLKLSNGWELDPGFGHLAYGYCTTSHAAQGKTVDRVFIAQGAESFPASSMEQFYVSVSRAREEVRVYTDDREALRGRIARTGARMGATELVEGKKGFGAILRQKGQQVARLAYQVKARMEGVLDQSHDLVRRFGRGMENRDRGGGHAIEPAGFD